MTGNKEDAFRSAVERAFRGNQAEIDKYQSVSYVPTDSEFQRCSALVMEALERLPAAAEVDLETFAFMVGIGPSALRKREDLPAPHNHVKREVASLGGKSRPSLKPVWTIQQVKAYRDDRAEHSEDKKDEQSSAAVSRRDKRKELERTLPTLLEHLQECRARAQKTNAPRDWARAMDASTEVIVAISGHILGFVDLHNLSRDELRDAFRDGARIERMTMRQALTSRTWADVSALQPWAYEYGKFAEALAKSFVVREHDFLAAAVARSEKVGLDDLPKAKPGNPGGRRTLRM